MIACGDDRSHPRMNAALVELRALVVDVFVMRRAWRDEVGLSELLTLLRLDGIPREIVEQRNNAAAEMRHFRESVHLTAAIDHVERLAGEHIDIRWGKMPSADRAARCELADELIEGHTTLTRASNLCRGERRTIARIENGNCAIVVRCRREGRSRARAERRCRCLVICARSLNNRQRQRSQSNRQLPHRTPPIIWVLSSSPADAPISPAAAMMKPKQSMRVPTDAFADALSCEMLRGDDAPLAPRHSQRRWPQVRRPIRRRSSARDRRRTASKQAGRLK